jgi:hypothetical protein
VNECRLNAGASQDAFDWEPITSERAMAVDREKLYTEVWAEPMITVAKQYGVSSSYLARVCERLNVPRPPRGHWAQLAAGKALPQPALPEADAGIEIEWAREGEPRRAPLALRPPNPEATRDVPKNRRRGQHALVITGKAALEDPRPAPVFGDDPYLRPKKLIVPDIFVTKDVLARALETANRIYQELEGHGYRVILAPNRSGYRFQAYDHRDEAKPGRASRPHESYGSRKWMPRSPTIAVMGNVAIGLTLFESAEYVEALYRNGRYVRVPPSSGKTTRRDPLRLQEWTTHHHMPSGKLVLHAYSPYERATWSQTWREEKSGDIGGRAPSIRAELERATVAIAKLVEEGERKAEEERKEWELKKQVWMREEQERRKREEEAQREKRVREDIEQWRLARDIRDYVDQTLRLIQEADMEAAPGGQLDLYLRSAAATADRVDPLSKLREEIAKAVADRSKRPPDGDALAASAPDCAAETTEVAPDAHVSPPHAP